MLNFDTLMNKAKSNGDYDALVMDENNNKSLILLADGVTAVVMERRGGMWVEVDRFERETYFTGGHWSDVDIDRAINGPY